MVSNRSFGEFLLEEAAINDEQLRAALMHQKCRDVAAGEALFASEREQAPATKVEDRELGLAEALVQQGALRAWQLEPYLAAYQRGAHGPTEFVHVMLCDRPRSEVLEVITNQFVRSLVSAVGGRFTANSCYSQVDRVRPCEYTIYQAFTGDFEGEVYLNLSAALMQQIAASRIVGATASLLADGACEFLNVVNRQVCGQLSVSGTRAALGRPLVFRHPCADEVAAPFDLAGRVGKFALTSILLAHPRGPQELCIVDRTDESPLTAQHR